MSEPLLSWDPINVLIRLIRTAVTTPVGIVFLILAALFFKFSKFDNS